jgi:hypothetical protein
MNRPTPGFYRKYVGIRQHLRSAKTPWMSGPGSGFRATGTAGQGSVTTNRDGHLRWMATVASWTQLRAPPRRGRRPERRRRPNRHRARRPLPARFT